MPPAPASASRTRFRRSVPTGLKVAGVAMVVALAGALLLFPGVPVPSSRLVAWQLHGFAGPGFDPTTAQTSYVVRVAVARWPTEFDQNNSSWLATPVVTYTPLSVTITLYTTESFSQKRMYSWFDTGGWVDVQLTEPLGRRMLFDGSNFPLAVRLY